jgi:hypothetical protein
MFVSLCMEEACENSDCLIAHPLLRTVVREKCVIKEKGLELVAPPHNLYAQLAVRSLFHIFILPTGIYAAHI